jgi:hypothetical protein
MGERGCRGGELVRFGGLGGVGNESGKRGLRSSSICKLQLERIFVRSSKHVEDIRRIA